MSLKQNLLGLAVGIVGIAGLGIDVQAGPLTLRLFDGSTTQTVSDVGGTGVVTFNGAIGSFNVNVATGLSNPALPGPYPHMDLNSVNLQSGAGGTMRISLSQTGFTSPADFLPFLTAWGGTLSGPGATASVDIYIDPNNALFSTNGTNVADLGPMSGPGAFAASGYGDGDVDNEYSVTILLTITLGTGGLYSGDVELRQVPEPMSLALLGVGLLGLGVATRRRRRSA